MLDADVNSTVTKYNSSIESHRNDTELWDFYIPMLPEYTDVEKGTFDETNNAQKLAV